MVSMTECAFFTDSDDKALENLKGEHCELGALLQELRSHTIWRDQQSPLGQELDTNNQ